MSSRGGLQLVTVTVWLQLVVLPQQSEMSQVRVETNGVKGLVTVPKTVIVTFVPQQASTAVGGSNVPLPHGTVLLLAQVIIGGGDPPP